MLSSVNFQMEFCKKQDKENMYLKIVLTVCLSAEDTYAKLADYKSRKKWDFLCMYVFN